MVGPFRISRLGTMPPGHVLGATAGGRGEGAEEDVEPIPAGAGAGAEAATWHTVSVVLVQAVFTPAVHVEEAAHVEHGAVPAVENVDPATQGAADVVNDADVTALGMVPPLS